MVESGNINLHRKFVANSCLYRAIAQQAPPRFLRRNLQYILDSHERTLAAPADASARQAMIANDKRSAGWDFPTREMSEDLIRGDKPVLHLDALQIRHPKSRASINKRTRQERELDENPDWLPSPEETNTVKIPCRVSVGVLDTRSSKKSIYIDSRAATITECQDGSQKPLFDIVLESAFFIELEKLFVVVETGANGSRRFIRSTTARYVLEVSIQCQDSEDTAELLSRVEGRELVTFHNTPANEGVLKTTWDTLPECPPRGHLLPLRRPRGHKVIEAEYQIELSIGWNRKQDSVLARYNRSRRQQEIAHLPTPTSSEENEKRPKKLAILYKFREGTDTRTLLVDNLMCPFCVIGVEHTSFDRLHLHMITHHDHFNVTVEEGNDESENAVATRRTVILSLRESQVERSLNHSGQEEWTWQASDQPFDIRAELRGRRAYLQAPRGTKSDRKRSRPSKIHEGASTHTGVLRVQKRPGPEEVEDLPALQVKRHRVPFVPDVRFYTCKSKKRLNKGDFVADDDEQMDDVWLWQSHDVTLERLGVSEKARRFLNAFDHHFAHERSGSHVLSREGLVRFVRCYKPELRSPNWRNVFWDKIDLFHDHGIIDENTYAYCVREVGKENIDPQTTEVDASGEIANGDASSKSPPIVLATRERARSINRNPASLQNGNSSLHGTPARDQAAVGPPQKEESQQVSNSRLNGPWDVDLLRRRDLWKPDLESSDHDSFTQPRPEERRPAQKFICICGRSGEDRSDTILCDDFHCKRITFHLECVGLDKRKVGWKCEDCAAE